MSKLAINVDGLLFPNPFVIGSGPPSTNAKIMAKAFRAGWGGVVAKTTSLTDNEVINVQPRYGKLRSKSKDNVGFQNIELISDATFEDWEDWYKETKDTHPDGMLIGSIILMIAFYNQRLAFCECARASAAASASAPPWLKPARKTR